MSGCDEAALLAAAVAGRPLDEIATAGGVSRSTAQRRLKRADIQAQVRAGRAERRDLLAGQMLALQPLAVERLQALVGSENPFAALRAIALVLRVSREEEVRELVQRLTDLERRLGPGDASAPGSDADVQAGDEAGSRP